MMKHYRIVPLYQGGIASGYVLLVGDVNSGIFADREDAEAEMQRLQRLDDLMIPDNDR